MQVERAANRHISIVCDDGIGSAPNLPAPSRQRPLFTWTATGLQEAPKIGWFRAMEKKEIIQIFTWNACMCLSAGKWRWFLHHSTIFLQPGPKPPEKKKYVMSDIYRLHGTTVADFFIRAGNLWANRSRSCFGGIERRTNHRRGFIHQISPLA